MTLAELVQALKSTGLPVAYSEFVATPENSTPPPPFICYQFTASGGNLMADNRNYVDVESFDIELYTDKKDLVSEKLVQDKLKELCLPYSKSETKIDSEKLYQVIYEIQLIGG